MNTMTNRYLLSSNSTGLNSQNSKNYLPADKVWGVGVATSIGYLVFSFLLTLCIVLCYNSKKTSKSCLSFITTSLIAMAVGSLLGDAVIHIMPNVYANSNTTNTSADQPNTNISCLMILVGFFTFFSLEKIFYIAGCGHSHGAQDDEDTEHKHSHDDHDHSNHVDHSHQSDEKKNSINYENVQINSEENKNAEEEGNENEIVVVVEVDSPKNQAEMKKVAIKGKNSEKNGNNSPSDTANQTAKDTDAPKESIFNMKGKKTAGYLIIISSLIHNVMDGIAIGISFGSRDNGIILATNIAIILHEIPKELGDAGILLNSKFNHWSVLFWNVFINITNVIGTIIGIGVGKISPASNAYSLGFVAGNFFYIALAEMIPEIIRKKGLWTHISQFFFVIFGIGVMFLIVLYESLSGAK